MPASTRLDPLAVVEEKVAQGERLSAVDGIALFESPDLLRVGRVADRTRRRSVGDDVYFVVNRHINYTNVCRNRCRFCAFSRGEGEHGAYTLTVEEVLAKAREAIDEGATEIHIVGGEHPALPYSSIRAMVAGIRGFAPAVHIKAFTASEIAHFAEAERASIEDILQDLQAAGLDSLPGGGAEIFAERVREQVCPSKLSGDRWVEVHQLAHSLGLRTNATMLYGHLETYADRVDHLLRLRAAQDVTGGFQAFIPLAFQPQNTGLSHLPSTTGADDLKTIAVSRLLLDNLPHIKTYWVMTGLKLAQVALFFGANDMDGTVVEEVISLMSGAAHGQSVAKLELVRVIRDTGRIPVERDGLYRVVRRFDEGPTAGGPPAPIRASPPGAASPPGVTLAPHRAATPDGGAGR
jgi:aminodeoxyfutalosine synthase